VTNNLLKCTLERSRSSGTRLHIPEDILNHIASKNSNTPRYSKIYFC